MKIEQEEQPFTPVFIILETREEATDFWALVEVAYKKFPRGSRERTMGVDISNKLGEIRW